MLHDVADIELKFIATTLNSKRAFRTAQGTLNGYTFSHPYLSWLWEQMVRYAERTGHKPGPELVELLMPQLDDALAVKARSYQEALDETEWDVDDLDFYMEELISRMSVQAQLDAITSAQEALERNDPEASRKFLATATVAAPGLQPRTKAGLGFETPLLQFIPTGMLALDYHIDGLGKGEVGLIMGVSGAGKSILATNLAQGALKARWQAPNAKFNVWHIDTENGERIVKCRHLSRFTGVPSRALEKNKLTTQQERRIDSWLERNDGWLSEQLFIYPAEYLGTSIEDIERELAHLEAGGHMPDIIIFDSPDHLAQSERKGEARWEKFAEIYNRIRALAKRYNVAIWCITQARLEYEGKIATQAAVADSKQKTRLAHITLSINTERDEPEQRFIYIAKNRTGSCRFKIALEIDWSCMRMGTVGEGFDKDDDEDEEGESEN
jgi:replicative DNA helicase